MAALATLRDISIPKQAITKLEFNSDESGVFKVHPPLHFHWDTVYGVMTVTYCKKEERETDRE